MALGALVAGATMTVPVGGPVPVRYALPAEGEMLMRCASLAVIAAVILSSVSAHEAQAAGGIALPRFFNPPPPRAQIADAQVWDPYPLPYESAGPVDSARPRDFQYPPPEVTRGRVWQGTPGTFPRPQPWLRSQAPIDYPNIKKRWVSSRRTAPAVSDFPVDAGPALEGPADGQTEKEKVRNLYEGPAESVPARPAK
jgi:hypothetical protein